jgi:hypothetical protein
MRHVCASITTFVSLVIVASCATASPGGRAGRGGGDLITGAELEENPGEDLLALILRVRPAWLQMRPRLASSEPEVTPIVVVIDGVPQPPGMEPLHGFRVSDTQEVRRLSASDATTRFGTNMTAGAIVVVTKHQDIATGPPIHRTDEANVGPRPGDRVRIAADSTLTGELRSFTADSMSVLVDDTGELQTFLKSSVQRLDVARGREPKKDRVLLIGTLGGLLGYLIGSADNRHGDPSPPRETFCIQAGGGESCTSWRDPPALLEFTVGGVVLGGLYGALFAQGERWESVPLLPAAVSADWGPGRRLQVGFSVPTR